ncbi:MAG TPA: thrombospondin type 3 repeat-containing protein [Polyangiaceae bacterium]|nr:thrombospondin type 3 repeat-containing protein [Polyangiaceae bacterium]
MRSPRLLPATAAIVAILSPSPAGAQSLPDSFRLDPLHPASPHSPFVSAEGPARPAADGLRRLSGALLLSYARSPLTVYRSDDAASRVGTPVSNLLIANASIGVQVSRAFGLDLLMPVSLVQDGEDVLAGQSAVPHPSSQIAAGELRAGALFRDWVRPSIGFVAGLRVRAPTGQKTALMGDGRWHPELLAGVFGAVDPVRYGCTLFVGPMYVAEKRGERLAGACAFDLRFTRAGTTIGAESDLAALRIADDVAPHPRIEVWGSLRQPFGPLAASLSAGPGFGAAPGTAAFRLIAAVSWAPQDAAHDAASAPSDRDLDGVPDVRDACPVEAGPESSVASLDGCPNLDTDGDGVPDRVDACVSEKGARSSQRDVNGCPDTDNDHTVDRLDKCPLDPAPPGAYAESLGCPTRARLRGDRWLVQPPLSPDPSPSDLSALQEIAFLLRATSAIEQVTIEVSLQGVESDDALVQKAIQRASAILHQLVELGVHPSRLTPVGAVSPDPPHIDFAVSARARPATTPP